MYLKIDASDGEILLYILGLCMFLYDIKLGAVALIVILMGKLFFSVCKRNELFNGENIKGSKNKEETKENKSDDKSDELDFSVPRRTYFNKDVQKSRDVQVAKRHVHTLIAKDMQQQLLNEAVNDLRNEEYRVKFPIQL